MSLVEGPDQIVRILLSGGGIRYGEAKTFRGLTLLPIFLPPSGRPPGGPDTDRPPPAYTLYVDAAPAGTVVIAEVGDGIVSRLLVHNLGDRPVLIIDGEHLVGAKQNRILSTTILVPAHSKVEIPVACVEQGRWGRSRGAMRPAEAHLYPDARREKARAVTRSVRTSGTYDADQAAIWDSVAGRLH